MQTDAPGTAGPLSGSDASEDRLADRLAWLAALPIVAVCGVAGLQTGTQLYGLYVLVCFGLTLAFLIAAAVPGSERRQVAVFFLIELLVLPVAYVAGRTGFANPILFGLAAAWGLLGPVLYRLGVIDRSLLAGRSVGLSLGAGVGFAGLLLWRACL